MFSWEFASKKEKSRIWYAIAGAVGIGLIVWGILIGLVVMSVVVLIFAGVYLLVENNSPDTVHVEVNENGIGLEETFYDYGKIDSFAYVYEGAKPLFLRLHLKSKMLRMVDVPLNADVNPAEMRAYLATFLPESEQSELSFTERLVHVFRL